MKNVDDLIASAAELADRGLSKGEIADELNVSRETASWLVERSGAATEPEPQVEPDGPDDIHVDWNAIGSGGKRLTYVGRALADLLMETNGEADVTVGIEKAGVPLATSVSRELETTLAAYSPAKHQWDEGDIEDLGGGFSRNFAPVEGRNCFIVDDTVTSGTTLRETIDAIRSEGGEPLACVVIVDKQGVEEIDGVPVHSLINVVRVGEQ
ncbi:MULTISPECIES: transcriptional regulator GfcR [Haloferax]|uniref:Transcriptional regulator GfcR n=3 Tax=Haloferax TaxID=2251 RepID=A0A0K1IRX1_HALGI|nr:MULTISPECIES: transcriptional regulator GfcR [Haloferax]AKU07179.1 orotate phosphoribosyltransferase-like protein [Haloferax gibbonsii]ELZ71973.1 orotate phosphoribosyltransferase-like protein [Haloferax prahovense DSM 18310]ELZ76557.1 orotate phosphoribosyltransferase-like protein [Haloferax gibbonsii ATCC 33959]QOS11250.1 homolog to orotate phosphoribosyltransferase [Haloferax gibbonsii]RDZ55037.1 orotate phosphoribosyltransferase-like protein [Haloferax sp. Atlit-4N]